MTLQYVILYLLLSYTSAFEESVYCALRYTRLCQDKGQHIACQYPDPGPGESCENYTNIDFTEEMRNMILHFINRHRQRLASGHERGRGGLPFPKPAIMMYVEWDRELAFLAQRLADQCRFVHDECRATVRYPYAGQTVGEVRWRKTIDSDELTAQRAIRKVFEAWWGEKRRVQPQQLTSPFKVVAKGVVWGHFTQLAVWKLRAIGCGAVRYGPTHPRVLLVCDYSHTNMLGQKTYTAGHSATCPPHTARRPRSQYPLLCSKIEYHPPQYEIDKFDDEADANNMDVVQTERTEEYDPDDDDGEEETTLGDSKTRHKDAARRDETDIYVKRTRLGQYRKQDEEYHRGVTTGEEYYKDTDVYVQTRKHMKNVQEYHQERRTSTTQIHRDFEEERSNDIDTPYREGHYEKKYNLEKELTRNVLQIYRNEKKEDFEEERRNIILQKYRDGERNEKKNLNLSNQDYSVVPLKNRHQEPVYNVNIPWRPKLYQRTSTTEAPEYETSIILVPKRKKGHRMSTATAATLPPNVMRNIVRTYHVRDKETRLTTRAREKDLIHTVRRPLAPSLKLDKEDIDQLFRDTGFKPNWTPKI